MERWNHKSEVVTSEMRIDAYLSELREKLLAAEWFNSDETRPCVSAGERDGFFVKERGRVTVIVLTITHEKQEAV